METVIKKDPVLLKIAKGIFGDIVKQAYVSALVFESEIAEVKIQCNTFNYFETEIDLEADPIILTFSNGKNVEFKISEWGSINEVDINKFREI